MLIIYSGKSKYNGWFRGTHSLGNLHMGIRVIGRKSGIMQKRSILKTTTNGKMEEESLPNGRFSYWV